MTAYQFLGRLHPLVLHFPITLLLLAAASELGRLFHDDVRLGRLTVCLLALGAVGAVAAATTGWIFAHEVHPEPALRAILQTHRWLGIATAILSLLAWAAAHRWSSATRPALRWIPRLVIWTTAALLVVTAHRGALLVWGADFFS